MHEFKLWAPRPKRVSVQVTCQSGTQVYPMTGPDERGFWHTTVKDAGPGDDYGFLLDDENQPR